MNASGKLASVAHQGHGRTRLSFRSERGNKPFFDGLAPRLSALPGVSAVEARPLTGSVILYHRGSWPQLAEHVSVAGLFAILEEAEAAMPPEASRLRDAWRDVVRLLSESGLLAVVDEATAVKSVKSLSRQSTLPPPLLAAGGMAALALLQIARGQALPPALTLLWYARALASPFVATSAKGETHGP